MTVKTFIFLLYLFGKKIMFMGGVMPPSTGIRFNGHQ